MNKPMTNRVIEINDLKKDTKKHWKGHELDLINNFIDLAYHIGGRDEIRNMKNAMSEEIL